MKKLLCLLMVLCFAVAAFAGCGPRPSSPDASSQISSTPPPPKPSSSKPASSEPSSSEASSVPSSSAPASSKPASSKPSGNTGGSYTPPASSTPTPVSTTTIRSGNTYADKTYGNLLIHSDVEDDIVTLENVKITGTLIIEGGAEVELVDCTVNAIELNRYGTAVTITAEGKTTVNTLTAKSNVILDESALSSGYKGFKKVITSDNPYYYFIDVVLEDTDLDSIVLGTRTQLTENGSSDAGTVTNKNNLYTYEPSMGGGGGGSSSYSSRTIYDANTVLNGGTYRNITISSSVGNGEVTLNNVRILGTLYINGGGNSSIILSGSTSVPYVSMNPPAGLFTSLRAMDPGVSVGSITVSGQAGNIVLSGPGATGITLSSGASLQGAFGGGLGSLSINLGAGSSIGSASFGGSGSISGTGSVGSVIAPPSGVTISPTVLGNGGVGSPTVTQPVEMTVSAYEAASQTTVKLTIPNDNKMVSGISFKWNNTTLNSDKITYANDVYTLTVPAMTGGSTNTLVITAPGYLAKTLSPVWYAPSQKAIVTFTPNDVTIVVKSGATEITSESGNVYKLAPGNYTYTASKNGFVSKTESFTVTEGEIASGKTIPVTLDHRQVANEADLRAALTDPSITTISITADISGITTPILVNRVVTIEGGNKTLTFSGLEGITGTEDDGLILYGAATVKNLKVNAGLSNPATWSGSYAIHVYGTTATLHNVTVTGANGGILVNGSTVTLTGTTNVSGNGFGGIEVSKGTLLSTNSVLNISGGLTNNTEQIGKPTVWLVNGQGTVSGTHVPTYTSIAQVFGQTQYYLNAAYNDNRPALSNISLGTNSIEFTVKGKEAAISKIEVDSTIYDANNAVLVPDFDFNFDPSAVDSDTTATTYGMSVTKNNGTIRITIINYNTFYNAIKLLPGYPTVNSGTPPQPKRIHFWVVAHDAAGNQSGHMGLPGVPATAEQADLILTP